MTADYTDEEWLRERHHDYKMSIRAIAREAGVAHSTVSHWFNVHGIERRRGQERYDELEDEEWIRGRYHGDGMTMAEIADALGCTPGAVSAAMERLGVEARDDAGRSRVEVDADEARRLRDEGMTLSELADHFGCSRGPVRRALNG